MNIDILGDRFVGMYKENSANGIVLRLEVDFTSKINGLTWSVFNKKNSDGIDLIYIVHNSKNPHRDIYHVLGLESDVTFDVLIQHSKYIIDFNMEIEEKKILLKEKFDELGELFTKHTMEDLRNLQFIFTETNPHSDNFVLKGIDKTKTRKTRTKKNKNIETESKPYIEENMVCGRNTIVHSEPIGI